jgi:hypothetical protein
LRHYPNQQDNPHGNHTESALAGKGQSEENKTMDMHVSAIYNPDARTQSMQQQGSTRELYVAAA